jgi:hypothetical protein
MRICVVAANASEKLMASLKRFKVDPLYLPDNLAQNEQILESYNSSWDHPPFSVNVTLTS